MLRIRPIWPYSRLSPPRRRSSVFPQDTLPWTVYVRKREECALLSARGSWCKCRNRSPCAKNAQGYRRRSDRLWSSCRTPSFSTEDRHYRPYWQSRLPFQYSFYQDKLNNTFIFTDKEISYPFTLVLFVMVLKPLIEFFLDSIRSFPSIFVIGTSFKFVI